MFVEIPVRGGGTALVNTDKVIAIEEVATEPATDLRSRIVVEGGPAIDAMAGRDEVLGLIKKSAAAAEKAEKAAGEKGEKEEKAEKPVEKPVAEAKPHSFTGSVSTDFTMKETKDEDKGK